ncbi:MAG: zinc-ribbon domain-containing protein [Paracoccaceae bacterium]
MRLICPNCGAQYEVDAQVIPDGGRDVQCSNCGHTWFQRPANQDADLADELGMKLDEQAEAQANAPDQEPEQQYEPAQDEADDDSEESDGDDSAPRGEFIRRELDDGVLDILRDEATRESEARRAENDMLETQPDLGIDESNTSEGSTKRGLRERMARLRGVDESDLGAGAGAARSGKRRDLLPDIEEINSTLRASSDREEAEAFEEEEAISNGARRNGFGRGFGLIILIAVLAVALYAFAPKIAAAVPALEGVLSGYVSFINGLRAWLDGAMQGSAAKLTELLSSLTKSE